MNTIHLTIDNKQVEIEAGKTILEAARLAGIEIPTLCHHPDLCVAGNCRVCVVEQVGARTLQASCAMPAADGMDIKTNSARVQKARKDILELLLSEHRSDCVNCYKNNHCELQALAAKYVFTPARLIPLPGLQQHQIDLSSPSIVKDDSKCIRCQRCVRTCSQLQQVAALAVAHKGSEQKISTFLNQALKDVVCTNCGQCVNRCPTGALTERNHIHEVMEALYDKNLHVVVQTAPAVRIALGEELGFEAGTRVTGKLVAALKQLGFDSVLDTDFTADLTIMEEGTELLTRLKKRLVDQDAQVALPMTTSCSPGWIKFIEHKFPEFLPNVSTCKSPQQMFGALAKTYYAQKRGLDPSKIISVSVMPCTAKKYEAARPEMHDSGYRDVDYVLTTRELARMIRMAGIDFAALPDMAYDSMMGASTGAAVIFGATGGVMEAALRTAYEIITGKEVPFENLDIHAARGMKGVREAAVTIEGCLPEWSFLEGVALKVAVAHGLKNAHELMKAVKEGRVHYHFIEVMGCPGGCLGGGGQPIPTNAAIRQKRADAIYAEDAGMPLRKSHENPEVLALYRDFLGSPLGHVSHRLLHTHYTKRNWN